MNLTRKGGVKGGLAVTALILLGFAPTLSGAVGLTPTTSASAHTGSIDCTSATLDTLSGPLKPGDHINVDLSVNGGPTLQVNAYVDQNIAGGYSYGSYNGLGLRITILGVPQTPIPLTQTEVESEKFTFTYSSYLTGEWEVQWAQFNDHHWNHQHLEVNYFSCGTPQKESVTPKYDYSTFYCDTSDFTVKGENRAILTPHPGVVWSAEKDGKSATLPIGEGFNDVPQEGYGTYNITATDGDASDKYDVTPLSFALTFPDPATVKCDPPRSVSGSVVFTATYCAAEKPVGNTANVVLNDGTTAEGFILDIDGVTWISYGNVPAGPYDDSVIGIPGYPNTQKIVLTGEDGSQLTFGPFTFPEPKDAADCEIIKPVVTIDSGECYYNASQGYSFKPVFLLYDNTASNIAVEFKVGDPFGSLSLTVPAGETRTVRAQDGWQNGVGYQVTAGGQVFDVSIPSFAHCKPEVTPVTPTYVEATCAEPNSGHSVVPPQPEGVTYTIDPVTGVVTFAPDAHHVFPAGFNPVWTPTIVGPGICIPTLALSGASILGIDVIWWALGAALLLAVAILMVVSGYRRERRDMTN